jgi:hypothetical protein
MEKATIQTQDIIASPGTFFPNPPYLPIGSIRVVNGEAYWKPYSF